MALTDDEANTAFRFLSDALRDADYAWVTTQVEEKLALGKVQPKKLRARELADSSDSWALLDDGGRAVTSKTTSAVFAVSELFSPQERLLVLLDGIDLAIPVIAEVAVDALSTLAEFGIESEVDFAPEADIVDEFRIDIATVRERTLSGARLRHLLEELRREVTDVA